MRLYSQDEEERIRAQTRVREWTRSKLIDPVQGARLQADRAVDVKRTNIFLRAVLAFFTALVVGALVALVIEVWHINNRLPIAAVAAVAAWLCLGLAEILVRQFRLYRFGVEEALAVAAVFLSSVSVGLLIVRPDQTSAWPVSIGFLFAACGGFWIYRRFGFVYAAAGAMACAAAIPFQQDLAVTTRHVCAGAILALLFFVVRSKRLRYQDEYPGDEYGQLQAAAWAGIYLVLNLQIGWREWDRIGWMYWFTYAMTWLLPIVGLRWSIREKDRALLDVNLAMALVTLVTNKPYLGWPRHSWDPILLGIFLITIALALRRWLSTGADGERDGFTSARLLSGDGAVLTLLRAGSTTFQPAGASASPDDRNTSGFDGGRSGGGGGGATF